HCCYSCTHYATSFRSGTGVQMSFTFRDVGTKYVRLTITDAQSRGASVEHDVAVSPSATLVPAFMYSAYNTLTGSSVTYDVSSSACGASPCLYCCQDGA